MPIIYLENQTDIIEYKQNYSKILLQFSATWCGPCKRITPLITNKINHLNTNEVLYLYIDIDKHRSLSNNFGIESVPTFFIYDKETDVLIDPIVTSDINELTNYCVNNSIPITSSLY